MERKHSIDLLRVISAFAVIIIHVVTAPVSNNTVELSHSLLANLEMIHTLMNWSVPVFFMITGYCLLSKSECSYEYCFSHIKKFIGILFSLGLFYALLEEIFVFKTINPSIFAKAIRNVVSGNLWDHMWFVYTIIGIYLAMPVIHYFMRQSSKNALILTGLLFFFHILLPTFEEFITIGVSFPFSGYLFYVCFGGILAKYKINKKALIFICFAGLMSAAWIITFNIRGIGYEHLAVSLMAMSIFSLFSKLDMTSNKLILNISQCTWGIYLIHPFFINVAIKMFHINVMASHVYTNLSIFAIVIFLISLAGTHILRNIPYVKKLF